MGAGWSGVERGTHTEELGQVDLNAAQEVGPRRELFAQSEVVKNERDENENAAHHNVSFILQCKFRMARLSDLRCCTTATAKFGVYQLKESWQKLNKKAN